MPEHARINRARSSSASAPRSSEVKAHEFFRDRARTGERTGRLMSGSPLAGYAPGGRPRPPRRTAGYRISPRERSSRNPSHCVVCPAWTRRESRDIGAARPTVLARGGVPRKSRSTQPFPALRFSSVETAPDPRRAPTPERRCSLARRAKASRLAPGSSANRHLQWEMPGRLARGAIPGKQPERAPRCLRPPSARPRARSTVRSPCPLSDGGQEFARGASGAWPRASGGERVFECGAGGTTPNSGSAGLPPFPLGPRRFSSEGGFSRGRSEGSAPQVGAGIRSPASPSARVEANSPWHSGPPLPKRPQAGLCARGGSNPSGAQKKAEVAAAWISRHVERGSSSRSCR